MLLLLDDASIDDTEAIARRYVERDTARALPPPRRRGRR